MKIKTVIYVLMIVTGLLISKYGLGTHNVLEPMFAGSMISLGAINVIFDYIKNRKKK